MDPLHEIEKWGTIVLTSEERERMRSALHTHMTSHPFPDVPVPSPLYLSGVRVFVVRHQFFASALALVLILFVSGGTVAFAAEGSLPGDVLYPIKVSVNEELVLRFAARTPEAKAAFEAHRLERRLEEAEDLVAQGRMTQEKRVVLETNIHMHASHARVERAFEEANDDAAVAADIRLESLLNAHAEVLASLSASEDEDVSGLDDEHDSTEHFLAFLQEAAESFTDAMGQEQDYFVAVSPMRTSAPKSTIAERSLSPMPHSMSLSVEATVEDEGKRAAHAIATARETLAAQQYALGDDVYEKIGIRLAQVEVLHQQGVDALDRGETVDARNYFHQTVRMANEINVFIRASGRIRLRAIKQRTDDGGILEEESATSSNLFPDVHGKAKIIPSGTSLSDDLEKDLNDLNSGIDIDTNLGI